MVRFDANDLRWLPTGEAAAKVRMSKEAGTVSKGGVFFGET